MTSPAEDEATEALEKLTKQVKGKDKRIKNVQFLYRNWHLMEPAEKREAVRLAGELNLTKELPPQDDE